MEGGTKENEVRLKDTKQNQPDEKLGTREENRTTWGGDRGEQPEGVKDVMKTYVTGFQEGGKRGS